MCSLLSRMQTEVIQDMLVSKQCYELSFGTDTHQRAENKLFPKINKQMWFCIWFI